MPSSLSSRVVLSVLVSLAAARACFGQTAPAELNDLMTSDSISASQSEQIAQWAEACVRSIRSGQEDALRRVRSEFAALTGPTATPAFRAALIEQFAQRVDGFMGRFNAEQSRVVVFALAAARAQPAVEGLLEALSNGDPATRLLAARGIAAFEGQLGGAADQAVERLSQVALAEPVPLVKAELCRALGVSARAEVVVPALAEIISTHTDRFRRDGVTDVTALLAAVDTLSGLPLAEVAPKDKPETVRGVANLLHYAVAIYTSGATLQTRLKEDLERIIYRSEGVLGKLLAGEGVSEVPRVAEAMMAGGDDVPDNMRSELNKWLGDGGTTGLLNAAPWSLPDGGGFAEIKPPG